jgi:hypothetical protein
MYLQQKHKPQPQRHGRHNIPQAPYLDVLHGDVQVQLQRRHQLDRVVRARGAHVRQRLRLAYVHLVTEVRKVRLGWVITARSRETQRIRSVWTTGATHCAYVRKANIQNRRGMFSQCFSETTKLAVAQLSTGSLPPNNNIAAAANKHSDRRTWRSPGRWCTPMIMSRYTSSLFWMNMRPRSCAAAMPKGLAVPV